MFENQELSLSESKMSKIIKIECKLLKVCENTIINKGEKSIDMKPPKGTE